MRRLTLTAPVNAHTGYGLHAIQIVRDLERLAGCYVSVRSTEKEERFGAKMPSDMLGRLVNGVQPEPWELLLHHTPFMPTPGKRTAWFTMWETTTLPPGAVSMLNRAEVVIVPSHWNASCFAAQGVTKPIRVVPLGVDTETFHYIPATPRPKCVFGTAARVTYGARKGLNEVIDVFLRTFPDQDDVELRVKCHPDCDVRMVNDPRVVYVKDHWSREQLAEWYAELDCFVSGARAEGWGLMQHEAMAIGRPVCVANYGGVSEFFRDDCGYPVEFTLGPARGSEGMWAEPSWPSMAAQMRRVYESRDEARAAGARAANAVAHLTWENHSRKLLAVLHEVGALADETRVFSGTSNDRAEGLILDFYAKERATKKEPHRGRWFDFDLTTEPTGIGDMIVMSPIPSMSKVFGKSKAITSECEAFKALRKFIPECGPVTHPLVFAARQLQDNYDLGNGHFIQRLSRAFGLAVPLKPAGKLITRPSTIAGRVAIHMLPGRHATWQKAHVHPRAREMYKETIVELQALINAHPEYEFVEVGKAASGFVTGVANGTSHSVDNLISELARCEHFIGIMSGPLHIATALGLRCVVIINFPDPRRIFLPTLKDIRQVESEWFYPQHAHLHQEASGPLVPKFSQRSLEMAMRGEVYPFHSNRYLPLIHEAQN